MLQTSDNEKEILLGNKQLLLVFFVVAALLGVAFTGGYMLGRGSGAKKPFIAQQTGTPPASGETASTSGETHSLTPSDDMAASNNTGATPGRNEPEVPAPRKRQRSTTDNVLGAPKSGLIAAPTSSEKFSPESGQQFLQITAVARDHAGAVAAALRKQGFHAHAVPKPGDPKLYRVIVGPIRDAGELASTRDSLRKTGFSNVIVQRYE
jgi:cell division septation protein DedD